MSIICAALRGIRVAYYNLRTLILFLKMKHFIIFLIISAIIAAIFLAFPNIDVWATGLFYNKEEKFFLDSNIILEFLHKSVRYITISIALLWLSLLALNLAKKKTIWGLTRKKLIYLILALAIGPGLVVNTVFKDHWGRARPHHTLEFGGTKTFTPPFIISDQCDRNCSFVSGDPSVGFYFFALAFAISRKRKLFVGSAMGLGITFGMTRIMQGAHFLSDVIFSGIFTFTICYLLYLLMFKEDRGQDQTLKTSALHYSLFTIFY